MIDTIAIIASDRIERMRMTQRRQRLPAARGRAQDRGVGDLDACRRRRGQRCRGHGSVGARRGGPARQARQGRQRAELVLGHLMQEGVSTRWSVRDGRAPTVFRAVSSHDRNAADFHLSWRQHAAGGRDLREEAFAADVVYVSSLSDESADAFSPSSSGPRGRARWSPPIRGAPALLARRRLPGDPRADRHPGREPLGGGSAGAGSGGALRGR